VSKALIAHHPRKNDSVKKNIKSVSVGFSHKYTDTKCFNLETTNGEKDDWSYLKIANLLFPAAARNAKAAHKTKFLPGLICQVTGINSRDTQKEDIQAFFEKDIRCRVEFVDYDDKAPSDRCYVRFDNPKTASKTIEKCADMKDGARIRGARIKIECLKGEEEARFWEDLQHRLVEKKKRKEEMKGQRGGRGGRGRGRGGGRGGFRGRGGPSRNGGFGGDDRRDSYRDDRRDDRGRDDRGRDDRGDGYNKRPSYDDRDRGGDDRDPKRYRPAF